MEIKVQLNDFDYIIIDNYYNGGVNFRMFSESEPILGGTRIFTDGCTQRMRISNKRLDDVINTLENIRDEINRGE